MLKALYIHNNDQNEEVLKILYNQYRTKLEVVECKDLTTFHEEISKEEEVHFIVIDTDTKTIDPNKIIDSSLDFSSDMSYILIGNPTNTNARIKNENIYDEISEESFTVDRPIDLKHFENVIYTILKKFQALEEERSIVEADIEEFSPIKLRSFYLFKKIDADAHILITKNKFMKVIKKNQKYTEATIQNIQRRKIKKLYLLKEDHVQLLEKSIGEVNMQLRKVKDLNTILEAQTKAISIIQSYVSTLGTSESILELTELLMTSICNTFESVGNIKKILATFKLNEFDNSEKTLLCSYFCETILEDLSYKSKSSRTKFLLASILCDCTLDNEDLIKVQSLEDPNLAMLSEEDQIDFANHPIDAAKIAQLFTQYPEVDFIIQNHHEMPDGTGFPAKISASKITQAAAIFSVANDLASLILLKGLSTKSLKLSLKQLGTKDNVVPFKEPFRILVSRLI